METDNGIKGKFSVGLGLFDYINPILYGITVITILTHMHGVMPSGLFWLFLCGAAISLVFGLSIQFGGKILTSEMRKA